MASDIAVPLDICLQHVYDAYGTTELDVDAAIKVLQTIIKSPADQKLRNLNAKLLTRIANNNKLQLWYVLRYAGFVKEGDRLICALATPIETTSSVLQKLLDLSTYNAKVHDGIVSKSAVNPNVTPTASPNQSMQDTTSSQQLQPSHIQPQTPSQTPQPNQMDDTNENPTPTEPTSPITPTENTSPNSPPNSSLESTSSSPQQGTALGGNKAVANMTADEKRAYVASLLAQKRATKK